VQVVGPATYRPGNLNEFRVRATDLNSAPASVHLTARLVDVDKRVAFEKALDGKGELDVEVPSNLAIPPRTQAVMQFVVTSAGVAEELEQKIAVGTANYVTHLETD